MNRLLQKSSERTDVWLVALRDNRALVWLVSLVTFASGFLTIARPIAERLPEHVTNALWPVSVENISSSLIVGVGLSTMYVGYELLQRKRVAWWLALVLAAINLGLHSLLVPSLLPATVGTLTIVVLILSRDQFRSKANTGSVYHGIRVLVFSLLGALAYGAIGFYLLDKRDFNINFDFDNALLHAVKSYLLIGNPDLVSHTRYGHWFLQSLAVVGAVTLSYGLLSIFRPLNYRLRVLPAERARARKLLEYYGGETDDFFKLWPQDKSYFFSYDGRAFVAYGVTSGVALCFADPVGAPGSIKLVIQEFIQFCLENGWALSMAQATGKYKKQFADLGLRSLLIGADAVIDLKKFNTQTVKNKYFRNICNRFNKQAFCTDYYLPPHSPKLMRELFGISRSWLGFSNHKQWSFFTGHFSWRYLQQTPVFVLRDKTDKALAFANQIPSFKKGEATVDLMRYRSNMPKNGMDFLFIEFFKVLQKEGFKQFNLGLSPVAGQHFANQSSDKLLIYLYRSNQKIISFKGLHQYKAKFEPVWESRYLYYQGSPARLAQIGWAVYKLIRH